ncbi:hypothetical protein [Cohnella sp. AR92]|uniref:hypothetical protein n=1 Tax=Cohnella sp. AR92 TaxID=648716 RepID=UPI000F8DFBD7|nr:hypothetical protein [Cohnella sp. AR92]RUS45862.1 hypothetical protein ELR57_18605 [Cohnella sp. AR92]
MKLIEIIRMMIYKLVFYYQKFQVMILSIFVVGIADYFILYEIFVAASSLLLVELGPVIIIVLSVIIIRGSIRFYKKTKENKHLLIF